MFTANSMNCLMEALGLALPYNGTALAQTAEREALARRAGAQILRAGRESRSRPRQIVTAEALDDAFALDMAMGGSTNTVLHALAIAHEGRDRLPAGAHQRRRRPGAASVQGQPGGQVAHGRCAPRRRRPGHPE